MNTSTCNSIISVPTLLNSHIFGHFGQESRGTYRQPHLEEAREAMGSGEIEEQIIFLRGQLLTLLYAYRIMTAVKKVFCLDLVLGTIKRTNMTGANFLLHPRRPAATCLSNILGHCNSIVSASTLWLKMIHFFNG